MNIKFFFIVISVYGLLLTSCKLSEDRVIYKGVLSGSGEGVFDIKIDGSKSSVQTIVVDIDGGEIDCEMEIKNISMPPLMVTLKNKENAVMRGEFRDLAQGGKVLVYKGSSSSANFILGDLSGKSGNVRVYIKSSQGAFRSFTARILWADGP